MLHKGTASQDFASFAEAKFFQGRALFRLIFFVKNTAQPQRKFVLPHTLCIDARGGGVGGGGGERHTKRSKLIGF